MENPILKQEQHHVGDYYEHHDSSSGCGCFRLFRLKPRRTNYDDGEQGEQTRQPSRETTSTWWSNKMGKLKEFSEVIAGPKWKNFIRKVGGYCKSNKNRQSKARFQYDPQSYALNFDNTGFCREEEGGPLLSR